MKTNSISTIFLSLVLITGMFSFGLMSSDFIGGAFAEKGGNAEAKGCVNANEKSKAAAQNKHCGDDPGGEPTCSAPDGERGSGDRDEDNICDADDLCPKDAVGPEGQSDSDIDGDGIRNNQELPGQECIDNSTP